MNPFRQGDFDCTCGIYAVINSIRLAAAGQYVFSYIECLNLYAALVRQLEQSNGLVLTILDGMYAPIISGLLQKAKLHLKKEGLLLDWHKPYHTGDLPSLKTIMNNYQAHLNSGGAVLFGFEGKESHWTVAEQITENTIKLFDSSIFKRLPIAQISCSPLSRKPYILEPRSSFFVSCTML